MKLAMIVLTLALALPACAPTRAGSAPARDRLRITQAEIIASGADDAYEAILRLRANFLTSRGITVMRPNEPSTPAVFVDGLEYGPTSSLKSIPANTIAEIRLYQSGEATLMYGNAFTSGVIAVTTRRR